MGPGDGSANAKSKKSLSLSLSLNQYCRLRLTAMGLLLESHKLSELVFTMIDELEPDAGVEQVLK